MADCQSQKYEAILDQFTINFDEADKDKSGTLDFDEVMEALQAAGYKGDRTDVYTDVFRKVDKDENCVISRDEFINAMKRMPEMSLKETMMRKTFKDIDGDGNGVLSKEEINKVLATMSDDDEAKAVLESMAQGDGMVNYESFLSAYGMDASGSVMAKAFAMADKNNDGVLSKQELMDALCKEPRLATYRARIQDAIAKAYSNPQGQVDYKEFMKSWTTAWQ